MVVEDLFAVPWAYSTGTDHVYSRHAVLRTLGILSDRGEITVREPIDYAQLTALAYSDVETVGPSQWADAFDTALDERKRSTAQSRMRASTWCLDGMNVHRWKAPKLEEKFQGNAATGEDTKGPGVAAARAAVRDGEDQIPVLVVAIDPELGNVPVPPPLTRRATDDEKLEVSEYNARGASPTSARGASPCLRGLSALAGRASTRQWTQLLVPSGMIPLRRNGRVANTRSWREN